LLTSESSRKLSYYNELLSLEFKKFPEREGDTYILRTKSTITLLCAKNHTAARTQLQFFKDVTTLFLTPTK